MSFDAWCTQLHLRADAPPASLRVSLFLAERAVQIGSIEPALAQRMCAAGLPLRAIDGAWHIGGSADAALGELARWLNANGLGGRWRDELLPVCDAAGRSVSVIERAAVRALGVTTYAVHLVGLAPAGEVWIQQRALDKDTDPGLWDTLMGGLVSAGETVAHTLQRETWEEAGLRLDQLQDLVNLDRITVRRPVPDGYMVEHIQMFEAGVPSHLRPVNQDGEVERFEALTTAMLRRRLESNAFTLEAAVILLHWIAHRGGA